MGVYYKVVCDERKERISPGDIDGLGNKSGAISHPRHPFGSVIVFAMLHRWRAAVRLVNDSEEDPSYLEYEDVTESVLREYNEQHKTEYKFTGES